MESVVTVVLGFAIFWDAGGKKWTKHIIPNGGLFDGDVALVQSVKSAQTKTTPSFSLNKWPRVITCLHSLYVMIVFLVGETLPNPLSVTGLGVDPSYNTI